MNEKRMLIVVIAKEKESFSTTELAGKALKRPRYAAFYISDISRLSATRSPPGFLTSVPDGTSLRDAP